MTGQATVFSETLILVKFISAVYNYFKLLKELLNLFFVITIFSSIYLLQGKKKLITVIEYNKIISELTWNLLETIFLENKDQWKCFVL